MCAVDDVVADEFSMRTPLQDSTSMPSPLAMGHRPVFGVRLRRRFGWQLICIRLDMMNRQGRFYAGTSGLVLPVPNKQSFPEEFRAGTRLTYYASLFNSIEINSSFYKIPQPATFARWAGEVPDGFRFTVKLWRGITHAPGLHFLLVDVHKFMHAAGELGQKKGCLLVQLPPGVHADRVSPLEGLLERIALANADGGWRIAVEFRHRSWYQPVTDLLLKRYGAGRVLQDMPASKIDIAAGETSFIYVR